MRSFTKYLSGLALLATVTVHAQGDSPVAPGKPAATTSGKPAATAPGKPAAAKLTLPQMKERASALESQMAEDARHIRHLQEVARNQKDVVKLSCVNDKLVELKAQMNMFDTSRQQFSSVVDGGATADAARPSFVELAGVAATVKTLRGEADSCIGVPDLYKQESNVDVTHPDFPDDPTVTDPFDHNDTVIEPPAYASPFV